MRGTEVIPGVYQLAVWNSAIFVLVGESITLVDTGTKGSGRGIIEFVKNLGRSPEEISQVITTHHHFDHIGSLAEVKNASPTAAVAVHSLDAPYVAGEQPLPSPFQSRLLGILAWPLTALFAPSPAAVDIRLVDGAELEGMGGIKVIHTPGHTPGSISLHLPALGLVIAGDAMQRWGGKLGLPPRLFTADMEQGKESIKKLAELDFQILCLSHFSPITQNAAQEVRDLARRLF